MQYAPYLTKQDYLPWIQAGQMNQQLLDTLRKGDIELMKAEQTAIETIYENLSQKYDLDAEFTPTLPYDSTKTYGANDRVTIDFPSWVPGGDPDNGYVVGDCVIQNGSGYFCITPNSDREFTPSNWLNIGLQYSIYYISQPAPSFLLQIGQQVGSKVPGLYKPSDVVYYLGHTYTALQATPVTSNNNIQLVTYANQPPSNVFPDDPNIGYLYWQDNGEYTIEAGTPPSNEAWTLGDNRSNKIMMNVIDLTLYWLHKRITPNNIPDVRYRAYDDVKKWMKESKDANINPQLSPLQPEQGVRIIGGSDVKTMNSY